jgi:hypothetical protein
MNSRHDARCVAREAEHGGDCEHRRWLNARFFVPAPIPSASCEGAPFAAAGEQSAVTDAHEVAEQHMQEEAADELLWLP